MKLFFKILFSVLILSAIALGIFAPKDPTAKELVENATDAQRIDICGFARGTPDQIKACEEAVEYRMVVARSSGQ